MPRTSPFDIDLSSAEEVELRGRAARYTLPYFQVQRAKMILLAAEGAGNDEIASRLDTRREVVSFWRKRFFGERLAGLEERPRPGRPLSVRPVLRARMPRDRTLTCESPHRHAPDPAAAHHPERDAG